MHQTHLIHKQRGSALIISLSILLVLTVLGISSMSTTALQERMAGNARDAQVAFEAAESGLRAGEKYIESLTDSSLPNFTAGGTTGLWDKSTRDAWKTDANWAYAVNDSNYTTSSTSQQLPKYMIQNIDTTMTAPSEQGLESSSYTYNPPTILGNLKVFQITSRGYGLSSTSRVMLQSYYGKAF